jgi:hypothetical protein
MITIRCARCQQKVFRYQKLGKGRLWHCWKARIVGDYSVREGNEVKCSCGNVIGTDQGKWIKMKQGFFTCSGTELKR